MKNDKNRTECRGKIIALVAAASFALVLATSANAKWIDIGPGSLNLVNTQNAYSPSIISHNNTLYLSWSEEEFTGVTTRKGVYVKRYNGTWSRVGGVLNIGNTQNAESSSIGVSTITGYPIVAWTEQENFSGSFFRRGVYVKSFNGTGWAQNGSCLNVGNTQTAYYSTPYYNVNMVVGGITPYVAWLEFDSSGRYFNQWVKHWNNPDWIIDGNTTLNTNNTNGNYFSAHLAFDSDGSRVLAAYRDGDSRVYVKAFNGSTLSWNTLGGMVNTGTASYNQSVVYGNGNTYVAYCEYFASDPWDGVYVKRYTGSSWELMGQKLNMTYNISGRYPSIGMNGNTPFVAWTENNKIYVKYWSGSSWVLLGQEDGLALNMIQTKQALAPKVAVRNNAPYVVWYELDNAAPTNKYQVYCKFYASPTATPTMTPTYTCTSTITPTRTITETFTVSPTVTMTPTLTPTYTVTPTVTLTITTTATATMTPYQLEEGKVITYPSPGKGKELWFYYKVGGPCQAKIDIFNLLGEKAQTLENQHVEAGYGRTRWDISSVAPGIYIFRLTLESATETKKFKPSKLVIVR